MHILIIIKLKSKFRFYTERHDVSEHIEPAKEMNLSLYKNQICED